LHARISDYDALCRARGEEIAQLKERVASDEAASEQAERAQKLEIEKLKADVSACQAEALLQKTTLRTREEELDRLRTGVSFRLGRAITAPFRFFTSERDGGA